MEELMKKVRREHFPLCVQKAQLITKIYRQTEGEPESLRQAKAFAHVVENIPIWIDEEEFIVGHAASKHWGVEIDPFLGPLDVEMLKGLEQEGVVVIDEEDWPAIREVAEYWRTRNWQYKAWHLADDRLWKFLQVGIWLPPMRSRAEGIGTYAGAGLGIYHGLHLAVLDYEKVLSHGLSSAIEEAEAELESIRFFSRDDVEKRRFLEAVIIALKAINHLANRFADLAEAKAATEADPERKEKLQRIAETCRWVPAKPARSFYEALQCFWLIYLACNPSPTIGIGRFDQYMYPFYKKDKELGRITDEEVIRLLCELRAKDMELVRVALRPEKRMQHAGMAKWHNMVIGGLTSNGQDATNELTYLILEAAKRLMTPHHTITLRVHEGTPEELMIKALEVVKTGVGMPAFVGDRSYIEFLLSKGVPITVARNYALGGCLDVALPGLMRIVEASFFVVPKVLEIFLNGGVDPRTGLKVGPFKADFDEFQTYVEFTDAFKKYLAHFISLWVETANLLTTVRSELMKNVVEAALMTNGIKAGKSFYERKMPYEINSVLLPVGMINVADSLATIKKLVFQEKKITMEQLKKAVQANWEGYEELHRMCLEAPKYGNDDDYADLIAKDLYRFLAQTITKFDYVLGGKHQPGGISISSMWAGGDITGATPDGRYAAEVLADGSMSPMRGRDTNGPTAIIKSASKIDQALYASTLLNMKFHPSTLGNTEDLRKLTALIKTYFRLGGKHVQFNVVSREMLLEAQKHPESYSDLVVRVAGYSAYFVQLGKRVQDEIIARTELSI
ncbi:MAG: formate C-acetyltransferase [Dehalococcoidia bacterium]|nr:formate C-acetyltransferase [Dehalococcoidia bacterium]